MSATAKFLFDVDFASGAAKPDPAIPAAAHAAAVAAAEARGFQAGLVSAEAQARTEAERRAAAAMERISASLNEIARGLAAIEARLEAEAVEVAVAVARKLAPELIAREPLAELSALAGRCFGELIAAPHVVVRVNASQYDAAHERLADIARLRGFEGRLIVLGEPEIALGDCRVEWADGGMMRDRAAVEAAIAAVVDRYVSARSIGVGESERSGFRG